MRGRQLTSEGFDLDDDLRGEEPDGLPGDEVVTLPARSALVLTGAARTSWMHGIDRRDTAGGRHRRISATFRTLA